MDAALAALKSQYHAALAMLGEAIEKCPDDLWASDRHTNRCWQVAYHTLFFAHFYSMPEEAAFTPWEGHRTGCQYPDAIPGPPDPESDLPLLPPPYSKDECRAYWSFCKEHVDGWLDAVDLASAESGFYWYPIPKLEHLLVNLRHIQHGAAQLADRLRAHSDVGVDWKGKGA